MRDPRAANAQAVWTDLERSSGAVVRAVIGAGRTGAAIDRLHEGLAGSPGFRLLVIPLDAVVPRPHATATSEGRAEPRSAAAVSREEVYANVSDGTRLSSTFVALTALASIVAAIGLATDNTAAVIGAMVVAPLLGPNMGLALGLTLGDRQLTAEAARSASVGILVAFGTAALLGIGLDVHPDLPELAARTRLGLGDILLALAAGCAGTLAYTTGAPSYLVGVMVAVALLPPTVASALLLGEGLYQQALVALLLVAANATAVIVAAMATFRWKGMRPRQWWKEEQARQSARRGLAIFTLVLIAFVLAVLASRWLS